MSNIFIAYRRDDSGDITGRIYDRLVTFYGQRQVFRDVTSLQGGQRFPARLESAITEQTVMLVIIGQRWLTLTRERREDPFDFGRIEIEIAMRQHATIIPVLVQGARMPTPEELPASIADLANYHSIDVRADPDFTHDVEQVRRAVGIYARPARRRFPWIAAVSAIVLVAIIGGLLWHFGALGHTSTVVVKPATATATALPLQCTDAQGNYPDSFNATGAQHAAPLAATTGISGQAIFITGFASVKSAFSNARLHFDPVNGTCTTIDQSSTGTVEGYRNFLNDTHNSYHIAAAGFSLPEVPTLPYNSRQIDAYPLGVIPNILIVNQHIAATIHDLSRKDIQAIFGGTLTNWHAVGGPTEPIHTIWSGNAQTLQAGWPAASDADSLNTLDGPTVSFKRDILGNTLTVSAPQQAITTGQRAALDAVLGDPDAIGFITLPALDFYDQRNPQNHYKDNIHYVTIDTYAPVAADITSNKYPFWNIAYAYTKNTVDNTTLGHAIQALIQDITQNPAFRTTDFPELEWLPLGDFSSNVLGCHQTKDPCN